MDKLSNKENDRATMEAYEKAYDHFKGDKDTANEFFYQQQRELNGRSGLNLIGANRADLLNKFIDKKLRGKK